MCGSDARRSPRRGTPSAYNGLVRIPRTVTLRSETSGPDRRYLGASIVDNQLHIEGQDLGPKTSMVSRDGEYEWIHVVARRDFPALIAALGGEPGEDILDVLERVATGDGSYELERLLRDGVVPCETHVV